MKLKIRQLLLLLYRYSSSRLLLEVNEVVVAVIIITISIIIKPNRVFMKGARHARIALRGLRKTSPNLRSSVSN